MSQSFDKVQAVKSRSLLVGGEKVHPIVPRSEFIEEEVSSETLVKQQEEHTKQQKKKQKQASQDRPHLKIVDSYDGPVATCEIELYDQLARYVR